MTHAATNATTSAPAARGELERQLEEYRRELRAYCYRMLGSAVDAEDAVQDTMLRAWRHLHRFEGRSSLRSWLYRIATNVCLDAIAARGRRALPSDLGAPGGVGAALEAPLIEQGWLEPAADHWIMPAHADPAEQALVRESVRLAFIAALQTLPPRQRAALILREVLSWRPAEIAELLDTTVPSVNSALQRARHTLASTDVASTPPATDADTSELLRRYVEAFERHDIEGLVALLHEDATWTMPPFGLWFRGRVAIADWLARKPCGDPRYVPVALNGSPGLAAYSAAPGGGYEAFAVQVLDVRDGAITRVDTFLDARLVSLFDIPTTLAA